MQTSGGGRPRCDRSAHHLHSVIRVGGILCHKAPVLGCQRHQRPRPGPCSCVWPRCDRSTHSPAGPRHAISSAPLAPSSVAFNTTCRGRYQRRCHATGPRCRRNRASPEAAGTAQPELRVPGFRTDLHLLPGRYWRQPSIAEVRRPALSHPFTSETMDLLLAGGKPAGIAGGRLHVSTMRPPPCTAALPSLRQGVAGGKKNWRMPPRS